MKGLSLSRLPLAAFGGAAVIYAILWLLSTYTSLYASKVMPLFLPFGLLWVAGCIGWAIVSRRNLKSSSTDAKERLRR